MQKLHDFALYPKPFLMQKQEHLKLFTNSVL